MDFSNGIYRIESEAARESENERSENVARTRNNAKSLKEGVDALKRQIIRVGDQADRQERCDA